MTLSPATLLLAVSGRVRTQTEVFLLPACEVFLMRRRERSEPSSSRRLDSAGVKTADGPHPDTASKGSPVDQRQTTRTAGGDVLHGQLRTSSL